MNRVLHAGVISHSPAIIDCRGDSYKKEIRKLQSQFPAVARAMHRARYCEGKSSATAAHESGPQVTAKAAIARQEKAIRTPPASGLSSGLSWLSAKCPTKA